MKDGVGHKANFFPKNTRLGQFGADSLNMPEIRQNIVFDEWFLFVILCRSGDYLEMMFWFL
ncbi:MAG: hypothetical protein D6714_08050 [Bacteroidetes bacterium]|nr:MAG: hypothetical protein D6714_08050 [Bacteroidota bacterium]